MFLCVLDLQSLRQKYIIWNIGMILDWKWMHWTPDRSGTSLSRNTVPQVQVKSVAYKEDIFFFFFMGKSLSKNGQSVKSLSSHINWNFWFFSGSMNTTSSGLNRGGTIQHVSAQFKSRHLWGCIMCMKWAACLSGKEKKKINAEQVLE